MSWKTRTLSRKRKLVPLLLLIALVVALALFVKIPTMTVVSLDRVTIEGVGWEDGEHRWIGDYWICYATTDTATELKLIKWNENEAKKSSVQNEVVDNETGEIKTVIPKANLEIRIYPKQPYYSVQLEWRQLQVYPKTYGAWINKLTGTYGKLEDHWKPELKASFWLLAGGWSYILHTPYYAELWKNGERLDTVEDDSYGGKNVIVLTDPNTGQSVKIENFGKGEYGYNKPDHGELYFFSESLILQAPMGSANNVLSYIEYDKSDSSYSVYWWSPRNARWEDGSPRPFYKSGNLLIWEHIERYHPGWDKDDDLWNHRWFPEACDNIYEDNPDTSPYGLSLVNWLIQEKEELGSFNFVDNQAIPWCESASIENNVLKLSMPAGSAYSDIKIVIPTEIADTIVLVEYYPSGKITAEWSTGGTDADIGDKLKALVNVTNTAYNPQTGEGFAGTLITKAYFKYGGEVGAVAPVQFTELIDKGETKTYEFLAHNTGAGEDTEFELVFEVWNEKPELCGVAVLTGTFLKTTELSTIVTVYTRDAVSKNDLSGMLVSISWDSESDAGYSIGGATVFDLGNIETDISLVATDPAENYLPAETTGHVKGGENVFYLDMEPTEKPPPEEGYGWLIWVAVAGVAAVAVTVIYKKRRKLKGWL